ncbi:VOC family protein [Streptomyces sp. DSM 44915]|uniref:VOC family protein n=1 Tax=Streptomyces chisholmiae TaxID=3075540 RepID=A0ABU2K1V0_9ACTN|nr:VOC family protein [Streptomyces sp. DSM 44915]MDT0270754.1 VOC family protein [Streptomyces sp. DSM 44915]
MTIARTQLVSLPVSDQDRARDFYVDVLGLELVRDNPMGPDQRWVEVAPAGAETGITLVTWFPTMPPGSLRGLVLQTEDVDAEIDRLRAAGVPVEGPDDAPWGRFGTLTDPDGNGLVLAGPPPRGA